MKKFIFALLTVVCALCAVFYFSACKDDSQSGDSQSGWDKEYTVRTAYAKAVELGYDKTLEEFISTISGKDGKDGVGIVSAAIDNDGNLVITLNNGTEQNLGNVVGSNGRDGVGIENAVIDDEGKLVITLSDGTEQNLGKIVGINGKDGVGIKDVQLNSEGDIIVTFTDESSKNIGKISFCTHSMREWETIRQATCTSIGYKTRECSVCGYVEYDFIGEKGHAWDSGREFTDFTVINCTVCGVSKIEAKNSQGGDIGEPTIPDDPVPDSGNHEFILPVESAVVSVSYVFGYDITLDRYCQHQGWDFDCAAGTSVFAVCDGTVTKIVSDNVLGNYVTVSHENGVSTTYKFIAAAENLKVGDTVKQGDIIGIVEEAYGVEMKQGDHLHFEVTVNGKSVDPETYFQI